MRLFVYEVTMKATVLSYMTTEGLITQGDRICVALSGGADSVALLHLLLTLKGEWALDISAVHIHHGIREASDDEAIFVEKLCRQLAVKHIIKNVDLKPYREQGMSLEMAAREARYKVFEEIASTQDRMIALAHHMDDQAETVLLNLFRGSGVSGLKGMLPLRHPFVRPLLTVSKADIMAYCAAEGLAYVTDESNQDRTILRNALRHDLMPAMEAACQWKLTRKLNETARLLRDEDDYMTRVVEGKLKDQLEQIGDYQYRLPLVLFKGEHPAVVRRMIRGSLERIRGSLKDIAFDHIEVIRALVLKGVTGKIAQLPGDWQVRIDYEQMIIEQPVRTAVKSPEQWGISIDALEAAGELEVGPVTLKLLDSKSSGNPPDEVYTKWMDYDKIGTNLVLRTRQSGDFIPIGQEGHRKSVKSFMIDNKVSRDERHLIPVLALGKEVLWLVGHRLSDKYKVSGTTRRILEVVYNKEAQQ